MIDIVEGYELLWLECKRARVEAERPVRRLLQSWTEDDEDQGFPDSSVGTESACSAGDPGSIPGLGSSTGEGTGYPLQYFWASLVAQLVKNPPAMWETCV